MAGSNIILTKRGDTVHFVGDIDETTDLSAVLALTDRPLRLNFRGVKYVNSIGLGQLIRFSEALAQRDVEFWELSPALVEAVNVMPVVIGGQSKIGRIKSACVPLTCVGRHPVVKTILIEDLNIQQGNIALPDMTCIKCSMPLGMDEMADPSDYFFFLVATQ